MQRFSLSDLEVLSCLREDLYLTTDHSHFRKVEHKNEWWEVALVNISGLFHSPLPIIKISAVNSTPVSLLAEPLIVTVWWKLVSLTALWMATEECTIEQISAKRCCFALSFSSIRKPLIFHILISLHIHSCLISPLFILRFPRILAVNLCI